MDIDFMDTSSQDTQKSIDILASNDETLDADAQLNDEQSQENTINLENSQVSLVVDDESQSANIKSNPVISRLKKKRRGSSVQIDSLIGSSNVVSKIFFYRWPKDDLQADYVVLQEQISDYLNIKSFKRKYPDLFRRQLDINEREYLKENNVVSDTQETLGLTALKLNEILEILQQEYPEKHKEFNQYVNEKRRLDAIKNYHSKRKSESVRMKHMNPEKMKEMIRRAVKSASEFNSVLQKERREERATCFDLQTMRIQVPQNRTHKLAREQTRVGSYPVALIAGQYQHYYKRYTSDELKYFPLNTCIYQSPVPDTLLYLEWKRNLGSIDCSSDENDENDHAQTQLTQLNHNQKVCYVCEKSSLTEAMITCTTCTSYSHPNCLELNPKLVDWMYIRSYAWQCMECKMCSKCNLSNDEAKMMFCDRCDRGYHTYCVGIKEVPQGTFVCLTCTSEMKQASSAGVRVSSMTPMKNNRLSSIIKSELAANTPSSGTHVPGRRGRPPGSLNKPKVKQEAQNNDESENDMTPRKKLKKPRKVIADLLKSNNEDTNDSTAIE